MVGVACIGMEADCSMVLRLGRQRSASGLGIGTEIYSDEPLGHTYLTSSMVSVCERRLVAMSLWVVPDFSMLARPGGQAGRLTASTDADV